MDTKEARKRVERIRDYSTNKEDKVALNMAGEALGQADYLPLMKFVNGEMWVKGKRVDMRAEAVQ